MGGVGWDGWICALKNRQGYIRHQTLKSRVGKCIRNTGIPSRLTIWMEGRTG
jgi:hypothetical protein